MDDITYTHIFCIGAWFIQMGVHEGAHALVAKRLGDDTAEQLGKDSLNPLAHIEWDNFNSILLSVLLPIFTSLQGMIPIGMAWVPINPRKFKKVHRDMALVSFAGPAANLLVVAICIFLHAILFPLAPMELTPNMAFSGKLLFLLDEFVRLTCLTSALYGFFNLIPIPPLDGSKVLHFFLPQKGKDIMNNLSQYGFMIILVLFWVGDAGVVLNLPLDIVKIFWYAVEFL